MCLQEGKSVTGIWGNTGLQFTGAVFSLLYIMSLLVGPQENLNILKESEASFINILDLYFYMSMNFQFIKVEDPLTRDHAHAH